jgi:large repetitive protein
LTRIALIVALVALCAGAAAGSGTAASFDDTNPCPASGPLLVCPTGQVGQPYSLQLRALAGCDTYWWEFTNGGLPAGLSMSSTGLITGVPTATGSTEPWVQVHDLTAAQGGPPWCGGDNNSQRQFVFNVVAGLSIQQQSVPGGTVNQPYSQQLTALSVTSINPVQGSPAQATWSIQSGSLPAGVTLSPTGLLSGTPTAEGSYTFVVKASGGSNSVDTETETLTIRQPMVASSPFVNGAAGTKSEVGIPFTAHQNASGGNGAFTWTLASGALPAGLALAPDGTVSGTPTVPGRFGFIMRVTDGEGRVVNVNGTLVVAAKLAFKTLKLKAAKSGVAYRAKIATSGGVSPMTWTVRGKLPNGVKFAARTATLIGKPKSAGTYRLTFTAIDALQVSAKKTLVLVVK